MAYSEKLADRVREVLARRDDIVEKKMFGGLAFMLRGNMAAGVHRDSLMVRVGIDDYEQALTEPHARPMDLTGKPLRGFVFVDEEGLVSDADLGGWVQRGVTHALTLPEK